MLAPFALIEFVVDEVWIVGEKVGVVDDKALKLLDSLSVELEMLSWTSA